MKRKKTFMKIMALILAVLLLGSLVATVLVTLAKAADSIDDLKGQKTAIQERQKQLEAQKRELANEKSQINNSINDLKNQQYTALQKKKLLDQKISLTNQQIDNINDTIAELDNDIEIKNQEYQKAQDDEATQMERFKHRLREMEENGTVSYYEILFDAKSFSDLLSRIDTINEIMHSDELIVKQIQEAQALVLKAKQDLSETKESQQMERTTLENTKSELKKDLADSQAYIAGIESDISSYEADAEKNQDKMEQIRKELEAQQKAQAELDAKIDKLIKAQQEAAKANTVVNAKGSFIWPSNDSRIVTSKYGLRLHPILGYNAMHNGVDIGAHYGTNILAADGGNVIISEYDSSYGNYVMIDHGSGRYTLYAHMSKRLVAVGDKVKQGDVIGRVGSTGYSTGAHIHFEVYINGKRTDPLQFFTNYVISE